TDWSVPAAVRLPAVCECFAEPASAVKGRIFATRGCGRLAGTVRPPRAAGPAGQAVIAVPSEQSAVFGLRLLSCTVSCLDSLLLLQSQYDFCSVLLRAQFLDNSADGDADETEPDTGSSGRRLVLDAVTIERNYVLVKSSMLGGPGERRLPARELEQASGGLGDSDYPYEMCQRLPPPPSYFVRSRTDSAAASRTRCSGSPSPARNRTGWLGAGALRPAAGTDGWWPHKRSRRSALSADAKPAGPDCGRCGDGRCELREAEQTKLGIRLMLMATYRGFDWFACRVFLLFGGARHRLGLLQNLAVLPASAYLWPHRMHNSATCQTRYARPAPARAVQNLPPGWSCCWARDDSRKVAAAFRLSGICPATVLHACSARASCRAWTGRQRAVHALLLLCGPDYQVYFCLCLLRHLGPGASLERHHQRATLLLHSSRGHPWPDSASPAPPAAGAGGPLPRLPEWPRLMQDVCSCDGRCRPQCTHLLLQSSYNAKDI
uniref:SH2 domain-containing protein n=1 Tax=Macrostomum lignano TaxID=282301 RepID=A0A1I8FA73_9PLAT